MRLIEASVQMTGIRPLLFDRYAGNDAKLEPIDKVYWSNGRAVIPQANIYSGLSAENTKSVVKIFCDMRKAKTKGHAVNQSLFIKQADIPITVRGDEVFHYQFESCFKVVEHVARVKGGIPNPKIRPMLPTPWEIAFDIEFVETGELSWTEMRQFLIKLGQLGLGTFRPLYGAAEVKVVERDAATAEPQVETEESRAVEGLFD